MRHKVERSKIYCAQSPESAGRGKRGVSRSLKLFIVLRISRDAVARRAQYILTRPTFPSHTLVRVGEFGHNPVEMSQYSGKIVFYEGRCFTGRRLEVYGECDNFQDRGFMNRVNSIRVESAAWICFDHPDFKGQQYILERGEYPEFQRWNAHNDHMGSCKPIRMHGEQYRMQLFEGCNYTGQCMDLCDDCPFLQSRGFNTNCINSVRVFGDGAWVMYEEPNFRGRMYIVERGNYCSHNEWQAQNPNIQSIRRVVNYF
ncbi:gamma-crystallin N-B [Onychostoma macrolepis]|uniref:Beta/gamma crystallin 'Greek key' domain-containing protein n=1 Tax=Onychostoma macrolepis TaxID=369639 RepID=A0A7J6BMM4_9TELE|nr:gamma-crystallin N-B [Onychostoma macrolepis]KAF4095505.1 hypothetical protein G5714_023108 [Onychostoma macrolepis]